MVQNCEWVSQYAISMLSSQSMNSARTRRGMLATLPGPRSGSPNCWPGYADGVSAAAGAVSWAVLADPAPDGPALAAVGAGRPAVPARAGPVPRRLRGFLATTPRYPFWAS
jgi:hypothetical protein